MRRAIALPVILIVVGACSLAGEASPTSIPQTAAPAQEITGSPATEQPEVVTEEPVARAIQLTESDLIPVPDDTLSILQFGGGGGGGECTDPQTGEAIANTSTSYFPEAVQWCVCGISRDIPHEASVTAPDGSSTPIIGSVDGYAFSIAPDETCLGFYYDVLPTQGIGAYSLAFSQQDIFLASTTELLLPPEPAIRLDGEMAWLLGYQPGEQIRVKFYAQPDPDVNFLQVIGETELIVDDLGGAILDIRSLPPIRAIHAIGASGSAGACRGQVYGCQPADLVPIAQNFHFCDRPCDEAGAQQLETFPAGIPAIYASWDYSGFALDLPYTRRWLNRGEEWIRYNCLWFGESEGVSEAALREPGGLRSGEWIVEILVNSQVVGSGTVVVEEGHEYWAPAGVQECAN
jgi:hypothetical protein